MKVGKFSPKNSVPLLLEGFLVGGGSQVAGALRPLYLNPEELNQVSDLGIWNIIS